MADAPSADKVANFFRQVLGMVAGAFERLRHEDNLQAGVVRDVLRILDVAQEDDIAQAVHLGIGAEHVDGFGGKAQEQVPDALESDHDFHARQQLPGFGLRDVGDGRGHTGVYFHINGIEFFFALPDGVQAGHGSGGNSLGRNGRGLAGQFAGFHGSLHQARVRGLRRRCFYAGCAHKQNRPALLDAGSALVDASGINPEGGTQSQKKHKSRRHVAGYNPVNFLSPPGEHVTQNRARKRSG